VICGSSHILQPNLRQCFVWFATVLWTLKEEEKDTVKRGYIYSLRTRARLRLYWLHMLIIHADFTQRRLANKLQFISRISVGTFATTILPIITLPVIMDCWLVTMLFCNSCTMTMWQYLLYQICRGSPCDIYRKQLIYSKTTKLMVLIIIILLWAT
jgi:hypothetical protein